MSGNIGQLAKLTNTGQLVSEATGATPPLIVHSTKMVEDLNVEFLGDMKETSVLRTDDNRTLGSDYTLTVEGKIKVDKTSGSLVLGDFELKENDGIFQIRATK